MPKPIASYFSAWMSWNERNSHPQIASPGVYAVARFDRPPTARFTLCDDVIYFGMTNSKGGLRYRLKQFDRTISGHLEHGGADRVLHAYPSYSRLVPKLYVAVAPFPCDVTSNEPQDLCTMGDVARFEYLCFAAYARKFGRLPRFNDKLGSPKASKNGT
jgi:hypothetical protein